MPSLITGMSVTFTADPGPIIGWVLSCGCPNAPGVDFGTYADAEAHFLAYGFTDEVLVGCDDRDYCTSIGVPAIKARFVEEPPAVNVSNTNAVHLVAVLGYLDPAWNTGGEDDFPELCGQDSADSFLGRVLLAICVNPADAGIPAHEVGSAFSEGSVIDCGRPAGYTDARLEQLRTLAEWAVTRGRCIQWG